MANGLMPSGGGGQPMGVAEGREPMQQPGAAPATNGQRRPATPEEQHTHDEFMGNVVNALYQDKTTNSVLSMMENADGTGSTSAGTLANVAAMLVSSTLASAEGNGAQVSPEIVSRAAAKVVSEIATEIMPAANMPPVGEDMMKAAHARAMEILREDREAAPMPQEGGAPGGPGGAPPPAPPPGNGLMPNRMPPPGG